MQSTAIYKTSSPEVLMLSWYLEKLSGRNARGNFLRGMSGGLFGKNCPGGKMSGDFLKGNVQQFLFVWNFRVFFPRGCPGNI